MIDCRPYLTIKLGAILDMQRQQVVLNDNKKLETKIKFRLKNKRLNSFLYFIFTLPALIIYSVFFMYPVFMGIYLSFTDWNGISKKYNLIGFKNFIKIFHSERFAKSIFFNFRYTAILIVFIICLSMLIAILLNSKIKYKTFFKSVYFFPAVLSLVTVGLIFNEIFYRVFPGIGKSLGIEFLSSNILSSPKTAIYGVLLVHIWQGIAMPTVLILAGLQSIDANLYDAAAIDGANSIQKFKSITFPSIIPVLNIVFVMVLKAGLTVFDYIMAMTGGGPGGSTESIGLLIYNHGLLEMKFSYSVAESVILFIIIGTISMLQFKVSSKKAVN